jgi:hypothetical protein
MSSQALRLTSTRALPFGSILCAVSLLLSIGCRPAAAPPVVAGAAPPPAGAPAPQRAGRQALRAKALAAYQRKDWKACAALFEQAPEPYGAACCRALAGDLDGAFAQLSRAIDAGLRDQDLANDDDLASLRGDPRWPQALDKQAARAAERRKTLNAELIQLYDEDQADRRASSYEAIDWTKVAPRDQARRKRVDEILAAGAARAADDYYHAAMVYQHGDGPAEIQRAHDLAVKAIELDPTHHAARWLAAAAEDRKLMYEHKAQKWGTQYKKIDGNWIVWPVDPAITDDQRAEWDVQPLADAEAHAAQMNARK